jgi:hypothetical protein
MDGLPEDVCWALETGYFYLDEHIDCTEDLLNSTKDEKLLKTIKEFLRRQELDKQKMKKLLEQYNLET